MTDEELRLVVESNARAIQAMIEQRVTDRLIHDERMTQLQNTITRLDDTVVRLTRIEEGQNRMLSSIDEDRPTVLRKLTTIENKLDRILENQ